MIRKDEAKPGRPVIWRYTRRAFGMVTGKDGDAAHADEPVEQRGEFVGWLGGNVALVKFNESGDRKPEPVTIIAEQLFWE